MSDYSDSLPPEQRPAYFKATAEFGRILAAARQERAELHRTKGSRAVAEAAWYPGHRLKTVEAIEAYYLAMLEKARERQLAEDAGKAAEVA